MAYGDNPNSFDADRELEELLNNLRQKENNPSQQSNDLRRTSPPAQQRQGAQHPAPQQRRPAPEQQRRPLPAPQQSPADPQQHSSQPSEHPASQHTSRIPKNPFKSLKQSQPKSKITSTTKNGIKIYEDKTDYSRIDDSNASYYNGEVYFASKNPAMAGTPPKRPPRRQPSRNAYKPKNKFEAIIYNIGKTIRAGGKTGTMLYIAILFCISAIFSIFAMSFVNDILAISRDSEVKTITVGENATTNQVINQLDKAGLIKHGFMCKVFMGLTSDLRSSKKPVYLSGVYYLSANMGLEKMLLQCQETQKAETVKVTIPEGYTIEQIAKKLEKSKVCKSDEFYNNLKSASFDYGFVKDIDSKSARYEYLEGYLYPETYEFFVDQNASSVINKLLYTSKERWTEEYARRAKELGMSMDDVLTLASIVQKEAGDSEQMAIIARIFLNRLNSSSFPSLQSDATNVYVNTYIKPNVQAGEYETYWAKYSTYACTGLPVGPICNPGNDAIKAVLWPAETDAYFFCHDPYGNIYTASTEQQHNANYYKAINGNTDD